MIPEAQHLKALLLQVAAAPIIFCLLFCVLSAIQFDDQAGFQAGEVGDVWPYCMLAAKLVAMQLAGTQPSPQMLFSIGHLCAQFAGILDCSFVAHASSNVFYLVRTAGDLDAESSASFTLHPCNHLPYSVPTIAEIFKDHGYRTYMSGKWHVTLDGNYRNNPEAQPNGSWPRDRGFDEFYGGLSGGGGYYEVRSLHRNETRSTDFPDDYYYTTAITENALQFIETHDASEPMFLYLAHYAPHRPIEAPEHRIGTLNATHLPKAPFQGGHRLGPGPFPHQGTRQPRMLGRTHYSSGIRRDQRHQCPP